MSRHHHITPNPSPAPAPGTSDRVAVNARGILARSTFHVGAQLFDGTLVPFKHQTSYLAMNLPAAPAQKVYLALQSALNVPLQSRREAHITVITPPEFAKLKSKLSMSEIEALATANRLQGATVTPVGLGMGEVPNDQTFFVVVTSPQILALRIKIAQAFRDKGGAVTAFNPTSHHPHITVGFTSYDIQEDRGLIKDARTIPNLATGLVVDG